MLRLTRFAVALALVWLSPRAACAQGQRFEVLISPATRAAPLTGRLVLVIAKRDTPEPRLAISPSGPAMFAVDLEQLPPGTPAVVDGTSLGYPRPLSELGAWDALYGPVGADGYPKPLWNKLTGVIDREVAHYWREHGFDLRGYAERHWATLGPKLAGKLKFFTGDMDDFYLNLAVYQFDDFLKATTNPRSDAEFTYGRPKKGHSWHAYPWAEFVRRVADHVKKNTPDH